MAIWTREGVRQSAPTRGGARSELGLRLLGLRDGDYLEPEPVRLAGTAAPSASEQQPVPHPPRVVGSR
jgi:hypothetical protein